MIASETSIALLHEILQLVFDEDARQVPLSRFQLHCGERFRYEYDFIANWKLDIRLEKRLPFDPSRPVPLCTAGRRAAPPEDCCGARDYLERLDRHRFPFEHLAVMAEAVQRLLDCDGDREATGDLDELRESVERLEAYHEFQPERFERRHVNHELRAIHHEVQP